MSIKETLDLDKSSWTSALKGAEGELSSFADNAVRKVDSIGSSVTKVGGTFLALAGPIAAAFGTNAMFKGLADLQLQEYDLERASKLTGTALQGLEQNLKDMSTTGDATTEELMKIATAMSSVGKTPEGIMQAVASVDDLSDVSGMASDQAAALDKQIAKVWGLGVPGIDKLNNAAIGLKSSLQADEATTLSFVGTWGRYLQQMGMTDTQTAALSATFSKLGVDGDTAMSQISRGTATLMTKVESLTETSKKQTKATKDHVSVATDAAKEASATLSNIEKTFGMTTQDMMAGLQTDFIGTMMKLGKSLKEHQGDLGALDAAYEVFGRQGTNALISIGGGADIMDTALKVAGDELGNQTEKAKLLTKIQEQLWTRAKEAFNTWYDVAMTGAEALEPVFGSVLDRIKDLGMGAREVMKALGEGIKTGNWDRFKKALDTSVGGLGKLKTAALTAFGVIAGYQGVKLGITGLQMIVTNALAAGRAFTTMAAASTAGWLKSAAAAVTAQFAFVGAWAALLGPIAGVVAGVGLVAAGLAAIGYALNPEKFTVFNSVAIDAFNGIKDVVTDCYALIMAGDFTGVMDRLKEAFSDAMTYVQGMDWQALGSDVVAMIGDGAQAIIDTAFRIGDWIYDTATAWVDSGGPRQLGQDIADAISGGVKWLLEGDNFWDALKGAFQTASSWIALGWEIIKGIGQGLLDRMYAAAQPAANRLLTSFATASYEIQGTFARSWNTILVGAAVLVTGIYAAFSGIGTTIAGYLQPAIDAMNKLSSGIGNINPAGKLVSTRTGTVVNPSLLTPEEKESGEYIPATLQNVYTSTPGRANEELQPTFGGYRTGGKGFASSELKGAGGEKLYMITDKGDFVTLSGKEVVAKSVFDLIAPYTADYVTNSAIAGQAWADKVMPAATDIRKAGDDVKQSGKEVKAAGSGAKTDILYASNALKGTGYSMGDFVASMGTNTSKAVTSAASSVTSAGRGLVTYSQTAGQALTLGGSAVRIGLTASGQEIAVIGKVAQQQFTAAGNQWVSDASNTGKVLQLGGQTGGEGLRLGGQQGGALVLGGMSQGASAHTSALQAGAATHTNALQLGGQKHIDATTIGAEKTEVAADYHGSAVIGSANFFGQIVNQASVGLGAAYNKIAGAPIWNPYGSFFGAGAGGKAATGAGAGTKAAAPGASAEEINVNGAINGNFEDMTCMGDIVSVNALKYTSPSGYQSYINPMTYNETGGVARYQVAGQEQIKAGNFEAQHFDYMQEVGQDQIQTSAKVNNSEIATEQKLRIMSVGTETIVGGYQRGAANYHAQKIESASNTVFSTSQLQNAASLSTNQQINNDDWLSCRSINTDNEASQTQLRVANADAGAQFNADWLNCGDINSQTTIGATDYSSQSMRSTTDDFSVKGQGVCSALDASTEKMAAADATRETAVANYVATLGIAASNIIGLANRGGGAAWGGTGQGGGGAWIGTGSTAVGGRGYTSWGGTALSNAISAGGYSSGSLAGSSFSWGAKGGLLDAGPQLVAAGERGPELVLPAPITRTLLTLTDMGLGAAKGGGKETGGDQTINVYLDSSIIMKRVLSRIQQKGSFSVR